MLRTAKAHWAGNGMQGEGTVTTQSGVLNNQPYSFKLRFENADGKAGTNPEELIAAAHSSCFSMALAFALANAGFTADSIDTDAQVTLTPGDGGFSITAIALKLTAKIPNIDQAQFSQIADGAKANCPISKALSAVPITLEATLA
ncbi:MULTISPECIES: OsmC family protein [Asticcacaulis]|uniref:OsmC family protein n=1 Tax=Asticcacaulis TaxID=76890 RepID=UPI001AE5464E|nr:MULTISPECIES: OsmC family protein [Asticcacaulis]MBP2161688.1 osmotically inducible protein OsmC [Asticcacaulis solisilvae]MDR6802687.1 osmotically inducible protein OsmC [Asticcacaulis sp. BE141]